MKAHSQKEWAFCFLMFSTLRLTIYGWKGEEDEISRKKNMGNNSSRVD
jgi:hypothetical protein